MGRPVTPRIREYLLTELARAERDLLDAEQELNDARQTASRAVAGLPCPRCRAKRHLTPREIVIVGDVRVVCYGLQPPVPAHWTYA